MNKLALDFWEAKGIGISKLVGMGKSKGIPDYKIKNAAEIVYQEITDGKREDNLKIALAVIRVAQELDSKKYEDDQRLISDTSAVLEGIKVEIEAANRAKEEVDEENTFLWSEIERLDNDVGVSEIRYSRSKEEIGRLMAKHTMHNITVGTIFIIVILLTIFLGAIF